MRPWIFSSIALLSIACAKIDSSGLAADDDGLADGDVTFDSSVSDDTSIDPHDGDDRDAADFPETTFDDAARDTRPDVVDVADTKDTATAIDTADAGPVDAGPCAPAPGTAGYAITLSSASKSYLEATYFPIPADFTIEAWIVPNGGGEQLIVAKDQQGQSANQFRFGLTGGKLYFLMTDAGSADGGLWSGKYTLQDPTALPNAKWSHVAVVKSGTSFSLYVDGSLVSAYTATKNLFHTGIQPFRIGARTNGGGAPVDVLEGTIDEVRVFRIPRTAAEIACDRFHELGPTHPQYYSLAAYWKLDEGAGTTAADALLAFPATVQGGAKWIPSAAF